VVGGDGAGARAAEAHGYEPVADTGSWLEDVAAGDAVVLDGPGLDALTDDVRTCGARVAVVDDAARSEAEADVRVCADLVSVPPGPAVTLVGPEHALVRQEFRSHRRLAAADPVELLVAVGGTDPGGRAPGLVDAAGRLGLPVRTLKEAVGGMGRPVAPVMAAAGAALSATGTTAWELLCLGVPAAFVVAADDQVAPAQLVAAHGAGVVLGDVDRAMADGLVGLDAVADPVTRRRLSEAALDLVDGRGAERVLDALLPS
jgi:hypothetical protein